MSDSTLTHLDDYCERVANTSGSLHTLLHTAEPINTITNIAFFIAAIFLIIHFKRLRLSPTKHIDIIFLIALITLLCIGSALWHHSATELFLLADIIPIALYIHGFLIIYCLRIAQLSLPITCLYWVTFTLITVFFQIMFPPYILNGSIMYAPALTLFAIIVLHAYLNALNHRAWLLGGFLVFILSITARTLDLTFCSNLAIGTHFLWHILNAVVLFSTTYFIMRHASSIKRN